MAPNIGSHLQTKKVRGKNATTSVKHLAASSFHNYFLIAMKFKFNVLAWRR